MARRTWPGSPRTSPTVLLALVTLTVAVLIVAMSGALAAHVQTAGKLAASEQALLDSRWCSLTIGAKVGPSSQKMARRPRLTIAASHYTVGTERRLIAAR